MDYSAGFVLLKRDWGMKKRYKLLIFLFVLILLGAGVFAGWYVLIRQKPAQIHDYTAEGGETGEDSGGQNDGEGEKDSSGGADGEGGEVVFSQNVRIFTEDEAAVINGAISDVRVTNHGLYMTTGSETPLSELGTGDVFYLDGSEETPLGEIYIGKIEEISGDGESREYLIETPMLDEVFDVLRFSISDTLTYENISEVTTADGVSCEYVNNLSEHFQNEDNLIEISDGVSDGKNKMMGLRTVGEKADGSGIGSGGLLFSIDVNLFEAFNVQNKDKKENSQKDEDGHDKLSLTDELKLSGKFGLEKVDVDVDFGWDILEGEGLETLAMYTEGKALVETELKAALDLALSADTTEVEFFDDFVKVQGLKEKMFPIAFISYNFGVKPKVTMFSNDGIRQSTKNVPLTIGLMLYMDINGNVSVQARTYINCQYEFNYKNEVVKGGKWIFNEDITSEQKFGAGLEAEVKADADAHIGISMPIYVFNLNVVELAFAKIGGEAEGSAKLQFSTDVVLGKEEALSVSGYARLYMKLLELNIRLKCGVNFWDVVNMDTGMDLSFLWLDKTIKEWGKKRETNYNADAMSYTQVTAQDQKAIYYKDTNGALVREENGYRKIIYNKSFFTICGIDESYLYVLCNNVNDCYDIYRIAKNGETSKKIVEDVKACLTFDKTSIYYVDNMSASQIQKLNRDTLKSEKFASFDADVTFMDQQGDNFYVAVSKNDIFAFLTGGSAAYYLVGRDGSVLKEYGENPDVSDYFLSDIGGFYQAGKMVTDGMLRSTAKEVWWLSADKSQKVQAEGVSGWNSKVQGIFVTQQPDNTEISPYKIMLYRGEDGSLTEVTGVQSDQAFFTLCQGRNGAWYFFDETDTELILYTMNSDFSGRHELKRFSLSEMPCSLRNCSMTLMDNRLYFYTIPDESTATVLYRYQLS